MLSPRIHGSIRTLAVSLGMIERWSQKLQCMMTTSEMFRRDMYGVSGRSVKKVWTLTCS